MKIDRYRKIALVLSIIGLVQVAITLNAAFGVEPEQSTVGVIEFTPPPDLTICFCGSYFLRGDKGQPSFYLASASIDLSKHIGDKVVVSGKPFSIPCTGTLLQPCSFMAVASVEDFVITDDANTTWGRIKSLWD